MGDIARRGRSWSRSSPIPRSRPWDGGYQNDRSEPIIYTWLSELTNWLLKEGEPIIIVPSSLMLTLDSIPPSFLKKFRTSTSTQAILAAYLTRGDKRSLKKWDTWRKAWPSREVFEDSMPILWPELSQSNSGAGGIILPPSTSGTPESTEKKALGEEDKEIYQNILFRQRTRLRHARENVVSVFPDIDWDSFSYNWCIVNTRSFYYVTPGQEEPEDWNDALGLVPFVDYFNHSDEWVSKFDNGK